MSTFVHGQVACGACGRVFPADIAESLHITTRPDLREDILACRFHRFACPGCGGRTTIEKLLAYTDFTRNHWFVVVPAAELPFAKEWRLLLERSFRETMLERCPDLVREQLAPRMLRRVVLGLASLREKLLALDAGLDDRLLEVLKLDVLRELSLLPGADTAIHLSELRDEALIFEVAARGRPLQASVARPAYDRLVAQAAPLAQRWPELFDGPVVDLRVLFAGPAAPSVAGRA